MKSTTPISLPITGSGTVIVSRDDVFEISSIGTDQCYIRLRSRGGSMRVDMPFLAVAAAIVGHQQQPKAEVVKTEVQDVMHRLQRLSDLL